MLGEVYLQSAIKRFTEYKTLGDRTLAQLVDEELHWRSVDESNSIAQIIQHLHGNMQSRWTNFLWEDGEKSWRNRDAEFEVQNGTKQELLQQWEEGWQTLFTALQSLSAANLLQQITIRTQPLVVVDAINRQLAHYSYHVGQMVFIGKMLKGAGWQSLSIPVKGSDAFNEMMKQTKHES